MRGGHPAVRGNFVGKGNLQVPFRGTQKAISPPQAGGRHFRIVHGDDSITVYLGSGKMPVKKSEAIERIRSVERPCRARGGRAVTKWAVTAMWGLLLVCADIGEAAARGRYSNSGPWDHAQISGIPAPRRANEGGISKMDQEEQEASHKRHHHAPPAQ